MSAESIYRTLRGAGLTAAGACGLMGNMQAESALRADNAQDGMTRYGDAEYTAAADSGQINFARDGVGYGLCQWTYPTRKAALLDYARAQGTSVGDERMQVNFCIKELQEDFPGLWRYLCSTDDVAEAARRVCVEYERPAVSNVDVRAGFAKTFFEQLHALPSAEEDTAPERFWPPRMLDYQAGRTNLRGADVLALQALLLARGYDVPTGGAFDAATRLGVMAFQAACGLACDGVAGARTWAKLLARDAA